jgi:hypothetical protein
MHHVYHLVDPNDRAVRYIGKSRNPKSRLKQHIAEALENDNTEKKRWIRRLLASGQKPVLIIAGSFTTEPLAREAESAECHRHLATITNIHDPAKKASDLRKSKSK